MKVVLSIAGSDSSGGAGIQADIKAISAHHVFAETAITTITVQNTLGVTATSPLEPKLIAAQIDACFDDIRPDAVKIGAIPSPEAAVAIADALERHAARNVVVDPVMVTTSGARLAEEDTIRAVVERLFPLATVVTPNIPEAQELSGLAIDGPAAMEKAARTIIASSSCAVLLKGGHGTEDANDLLCLPDGSSEWIMGRRIQTSNTHGTGCTLSSAIASRLALGHSLIEAVVLAKEYLSGALAAGLDLGRGSGPLDHMWKMG